MTHTPFLVENDSEYLKILAQVHFLGNFSVNHVFTHVAQEVAGLLQHAYLGQADDGNPAGTIAIRAIEPEYKQIFAAEPLTERELEVLQLIVDGHSNGAIAQALYISTGTVKFHVRNT